MKLQRALFLTSGLVAFSGLLSLLFTMTAPLWLLLPAMALAGTVSAYPSAAQRLKLPAGMVAWLAGAAFGFSVLDFFYIGGSLVAAGADFMVLLLCLKLLSLDSHKDYVQLYAASFFVLLASTGLSTEIYFIVPFMMFFVAAGWALMLLTVRTEAEGVSRQGARFTFGGGFFGGTALLSLVAFALTLAIFFAIPRIGIGFMSKRAGGLLRTSGFSDTVELGSMGEVKLDPTVVMRVRLPGSATRPDMQFYWRGRTFDRYDGKSWEDTFSNLTVVYGDRGGVFALRPGEDIPGGMLVQEVALEPLDTPTLFALNPAYMVKADFRMMQVRRAGELSLGYPPGNRVHYTVYSAPEGGSYRPADRPVPKHLQLPPGSERLAALSVATTSGARTDRDKAAAVMAYLNKNSRYTLDVRRAGSLSPMDDFLFGSRSGYCEHFATAMVLMLRGSGMYARIVSGFSGGEWNSYGSYFLVREKDAHTWVEAYIPGEGWAVFDPTPPSAVEGESLSWLGKGGGILDYARYRWDRYIVYYNIKDQMQAAGFMMDAYYRAKGFVSGITSMAKEGLPDMDGSGAGTITLKVLAGWVGGILAAAALIFVMWQYMRGRGTLGGAAVVWFYANMVKALRKKGYVRKPGVTPMEFARSLPAGDGHPGTDAVYVTGLYYRVRYGGAGLGADELDGIRHAVERIKR